MKLRKIFQRISLLLFLVLLVSASFPLAERIPVDLFLRMDPLAFLGTIISGRAWVWQLLPALLIAGLTVVLGRFFCSSICPLGATIDLTDRLLHTYRRKNKKTKQGHSSLPMIKYLILLFILGAALAGVSFVFAASPLSIVTRLYGLVLYPAAAILLDLGVSGIREAGNLLGITVFEYTAIPTPQFDLQWTTIALAILILGSGIIRRRLWCRYLCPAGAIFALLSRRPLYRRQVSESCNRCGVCRKSCPMDAISADPVQTRFDECIVCGKCVNVCPRHAVSIGSARGGNPGRDELFAKNRRAFILSGVAGLGTAVLSVSLPGRLYPGERSVSERASSLIRPPGSPQEEDFLAKCIRCGECMAACPTNTLQPIGLSAGIVRFLSPVVKPRKGPCEVSCTRCGHVCPTGAIRTLSRDEKVWAKIGTAEVIKHRCIAWESGRECLVCDEVCPFGAVELIYDKKSKAPVPIVHDRKCNGCGLCEYSCPVAGSSAIVVTSRQAFRMKEGSYHRAGKEGGFEFEVKQPSSYGSSRLQENSPGEADALPPGFDE